MPVELAATVALPPLRCKRHDAPKLDAYLAVLIAAEKCSMGQGQNARGEAHTASRSPAPLLIDEKARGKIYWHMFLLRVA